MLNLNRWGREDQHKLPGDSWVASVTSKIAISVGSLVLVGWCFHVTILKLGFSGSAATMKANTALCLLLSGVSLWLLQRGMKQLGHIPHFPYLGLSRVCAIAVAIISGLTLIEYSFGGNFGIDEMLFRDSPIVVTTSYPGRMGINTAANSLLIGVALYLLGGKKSRRRSWAAQLLAMNLSGVNFLKVNQLRSMTRFTT